VTVNATKQLTQGDIEIAKPFVHDFKRLLVQFSLNLEDIARLSGLSKSTVYSEARKGRLEYWCGRASQSEVSRWLTERRKTIGLTEQGRLWLEMFEHKTHEK